MSRSSPPFNYIKSFGTNFHMKPKLLSRPIHYEEHIINILKNFKPKNGQPDWPQWPILAALTDLPPPISIIDTSGTEKRSILYIIMEKIKNTTQIKQKGPSRPTRINQTSQDDWSATESTLIKSAKLIDISKSILQY